MDDKKLKSPRRSELLSLLSNEDLKELLEVDWDKEDLENCKGMEK